MADLLQRITGNLTIQEQTDPQQNKIAIHPFVGAFQEGARGKVTQANIISAFNLDATQSTNLSDLIALYLAAPDRITFIRVFKDIMYLGERNKIVGGNNYQNTAESVSRLQTEVTDQGGTLP
jgi:hypothetical protein